MRFTYPEKNAVNNNEMRKICENTSKNFTCETNMTMSSFLLVEVRGPKLRKELKCFHISNSQYKHVGTLLTCL